MTSSVNPIAAKMLNGTKLKRLLETHNKKPMKIKAIAIASIFRNINQPASLLFLSLIFPQVNLNKIYLEKHSNLNKLLREGYES
ncbi:hypothetical protein GCM10010954_17260 [Halobacillus andaensis]|uniref:Uncharacterized protein n=1 Tax=Halobacillus andaensis TaxID=1176239 RepID=A0A917EX46_HALAA|nr:hypothetical protein GCM10010954_17260 [Halobacillus andaensis]